MIRYSHGIPSYGDWARWIIPLGLLAIGFMSVLAIWAYSSLRQRAEGTAVPAPVLTVQPEVTLVPATFTQEISTNTAMPPSKTAGMVLIPGGEFLMGSTDDMKDAKEDERPQHPVVVRSYWIDEHEVTVSEYRECAIAGACEINEIRSEYVPVDYFTNPRYDSYPVVDVTWQDAGNFCIWKSRRLPTEAEWELAAGGMNNLVYPWGNEAGGFLNFCDLNCPAAWRNTLIDDGYPHQAPVGSYAEGRSPFGLYDMAGNVWEWVADWYAEDYYLHSPAEDPQGPGIGTERVVRGGGWDSPFTNVRVTKRFHHRPALYTGSLSFRCATDATQ